MEIRGRRNTLDTLRAHGMTTLGRRSTLHTLGTWDDYTFFGMFSTPMEREHTFGA